ncbi:hypothetical protein [Pseudomonas sp. Marseille-Q1929]|uniref:hypothetical protein n=1 Tax=Pseudomonas sp. Marseille-Q1929 TaxID=2730402 RepID=UPI001A90BD3E|nr:hypothetical protein [Pseudomonas sp. Marseille-Q1929]MBO0492612.1 hypothetical protein [Pseudomonas sp. Marseille-Q1929]
MTMPNPMGTYVGGSVDGPKQLTITAANSSSGAVVADFHDGKNAYSLTGTYKFANAANGGPASFNLDGDPNASIAYRLSLVSNPVDNNTPFQKLTGNYWVNGLAGTMELLKTN